jgi:hypothetical protein
MSIATPQAEKRVLLSNIDWSTFVDLARSDRAGARFTYDHGYLEIMPLSLRHERTKKRLAMMVEAAARKMGFPLVGAGSTTLKIAMKRRGVEPDECYYLAHAGAVRDLDETKKESAFGFSSLTAPTVSNLQAVRSRFFPGMSFRTSSGGSRGSTKPKGGGRTSSGSAG